MKVRQTLFRRISSVVLQIEKERTPPSRVRIKTRVPTSIEGKLQARKSDNFVQPAVTRRGRDRISVLSARPPGRISEQSQYSGKAQPYDLIHKEKEQGSDRGQQEDHAGRDEQLASRRPFDLGDFAPDFLHELQWRDLRHPVQPCASSDRGDSRTEVELQSCGRKLPIPLSNSSCPACRARLRDHRTVRHFRHTFEAVESSYRARHFANGSGRHREDWASDCDDMAESPLDFINRPFSFILLIIVVGAVLAVAGPSDLHGFSRGRIKSDRKNHTGGRHIRHQAG